MKLLTLFAALGFAFTITAQEKIQIRDNSTQETMPFVKVIPQGKPGLLSDLDGFFTINLNETASFQLKFIGYKDTIIQVTSLGTDRIVFMDALSEMLDEVKIIPGE